MKFCLKKFCVLYIIICVSLYASPEVSVILPIYNTEKFLVECLESILNQSFYDFELICVNDGSTDNSGSILLTYAEHDSRIKVITQKNHGVASARNAGLQLATGKYIAFVDADDVIHKDMLSILTNIIEKYNSDMVMCNFIRDNNIDINSIDVKSVDNVRVFVTYPQKPLDYGMYQVCWNKLYKKSAINGIKFKDGMTISEDLYFNFLVFARIKKYVYVPRVLYNYRYNMNSVTETCRGFSLKNIDDFIFAIRDIYIKTPSSRIEKTDLMHNVLNYLALYLWGSTNSVKESLYAAREINTLYRDGIVDTKFCFFTEKCYMLFIVIIGYFVNLFN